ncbi:MAG: response regulator [Spirochaetes bacterium]|nr:response regulator [Spirochaetota bacterium]
MVSDIIEKFAQDEKLNGYREDGSKISVLIVDDSFAFRRLMSRIFNLTGYEVVEEVEDGALATSKYGFHRPDIVTMDVTMPNMDGNAAVEEIMSIDPNAKIIMVTSLSHKELVEECLKRGVKGYILKPITEKQIPKILETIKNIAIGDKK